MIKHMMIAGVAAITPAACETEEPTTDARPAQVIIVGEDYNYPFDARSGDTINLVMNPDDKQAMTDRCNHSGGRLNYNFATLLWICEDVDF
jgi:hypothetical protein